MKIKKAQTGTAITWFVGFLAVVLILIIFFLIGFTTTKVEQALKGKPEIARQDQESVYMSEQQRNLFSLMENKQNYDILNKFVLELKEITPRDRPEGPYLKSIGENYEILNETLVDYHKQRNQEHYWVGANDQNVLRFRNSDEGPGYECWMFLILDKQRDGGIFRRESPFHFMPADISPQRGRTDLPVFAYPKAYSFVFPEKPFALIKYVRTECPNKN